MELTRQTLIEIRQAAESCMHDDMNPTWLRAYQDLAQAACVVDAFIARASGVETAGVQAASNCQAASNP